MSKTSLSVVAIVALAALMACPQRAAAQSCDANPYSYWGVSQGYVDDFVPYYIRHPPVYYGYSMLLPQGPGFTIRSYSPEAEVSVQSQPPLVLTNPYLGTTANGTRVAPVRLRNPFCDAVIDPSLGKPL